MSFFTTLFGTIFNLFLTILLIPFYLALFVIGLIHGLILIICAPIRRMIRKARKSKENYHKGY